METRLRQTEAVMEREERIRRRAYNIWCAEGWPRGRDKEHWAEASKAVEHDIGQVKEAVSADGLCFTQLGDRRCL